MQETDINKFNETMTAARARLPLPFETRIDPNDQAMALFIEDLKAAGSNDDVITKAHQFKQKELRMVFPALLSEPGAEKKLQDRLFLLIRERASMSMYNIGWLVFQQNPDNQIVQKALALLCSILEIKRQSYTPGTSGANVKLPAGELPLISQLLPPNSRQFAKRLWLALTARRLKLEDFKKSYGLQDETRLNAELTALQMITVKNFNKENVSSFGLSIRLSGKQMQGELVQSFLSTQETSGDSFSTYYTLIKQELGAPWEENAVWQQVKDKEKAIYKNWLMHNTIISHCGNSEIKKAFYLRYLQKMDRIEQWSEDTVLFYFDFFVLADNKENSDFAIYYGRKEPTEHPYELAQGLAETEQERDPASSAIPHISCEEAISKADSGKIVILYFNSDELRCSGAFIDFCLQNNRGATSSLRSKLFN